MISGAGEADWNNFHWDGSHPHDTLTAGAATATVVSACGAVAPVSALTP